jgi:N-acetylglucosamine-6-phosphate deacetylase
VTTVLAGRLAIGEEIAPGWVEISSAGIEGAGHGASPRVPDETVAGVLAPGLCDLQVNGAAGHETTGDDRALDAIEEALVRRGVTRFLTTVTTIPDEQARDAVRRLSQRARDPDSAVAGIHLEGPFLSPEHPGVHPTELLRVPAEGVPAHYDDPAVRVVTLAPELPGAIELIERLHARGVTVALGHTGADAATIERATAAGARMVTHVFNAMAPLHHRAPGPAGTALVDDRLAVGVIADGQHVDARVLELVRRAAGRRVVLVSDASPAAGAAPGAYGFANRTVVLGADGAVRDAEGRLAGSGALLDDVLATWLASTGATLGDAIAAAASTPAAVGGLAPGLTPGAPADLVEIRDDGRVVRVMRAGRWLVPALRDYVP